MEVVNEMARKYRYSELRERAERIVKMRLAHARKLCASSGLDANLLGIHPHNAMIDYRAGRPWPGIDYSKVRACMRELEHEFDAMRVLDKFVARLRAEDRLLWN
jgi:hypothetical protein